MHLHFVIPTLHQIYFDNGRLSRQVQFIHGTTQFLIIVNGDVDQIDDNFFIVMVMNLGQFKKGFSLVYMIYQVGWS